MPIPGIQDRAFIRFGPDEVIRCANYSIEMGVMQQPGRFALRLGLPGQTATLVKRYPKGTPFELYIHNADSGANLLQFGGFTDGVHGSGRPFQLTFSGRDQLAKLQGTDAVKDKKYGNATYVSLTTDVLKDAGYESAEVSDGTLDDLKTKSGVSRVPDDAFRRETGFGARTRKIIHRPPQITVGQNYFTFLRKHLDRAGMFLVALAGGGFALMQPDPATPAIYSLVNPGGPVDFSKAGNVVDVQYMDDAAGRCSEIVVFCDAGGAQFGLTQPKGSFPDEEMKGARLIRPRAFIDAAASTHEEAEFLARRRLAESRRDGWRLIYRVAGHTTPSWNGNGRLVWSRNTMVNVVDDELGIKEKLFIESLALYGDESRTWTELRLMRPEDLLFGDLES